MVTRTVSGIIGGLLILMILIFNQSIPILINLFVALICILTIYEICIAMGINKIFKIMLPSVVFSAILPIFGHGAVWKASWYIYTLVMVVIMIFFRKSLSFKNIAVIYCMTILISLSLSAIIDLRNWGGNYSNFYVLFALCIPWMADTGAYFCGNLFGKTKLCPDVSPKKTVEGAVGGIFFCITTNIIIAFVFETWLFKPPANINYFYLVLIVVIGSIISIIGDLCFSLVKRSYRVKDFGNVIPGHGGVLDRFDSVIFVVPFVYFIVKHLDLLS
ncbi:MAG: phosphatidate cytidylyltransferase [Eubacteriales bacterium SKADARSKE-1]|nr:phosphatidate cytidylyltransferase [Eubacteriales bacterium SKADARSKE-1]